MLSQSALIFNKMAENIKIVSSFVYLNNFSFKKPALNDPNQLYLMDKVDISVSILFKLYLRQLFKIIKTLTFILKNKIRDR